jgi:MoaA/NifB/PqqE/SkfB family radical SAM enzyme
MANIGYIQMVRHCNQNCGFCSNPETPFFHNMDQIRTIIDDFAARDYFGVILTGGEPTLSPVLPEAIAYAREKNLHVRMITNGQKMADRAFTFALADAGLQHVHVSIHSNKHKLEDFLTGTPGSLAWAEQALTHLGETPIAVNINTVINRYNCDHLHETIDWFIDRFPFIHHFVWNNLDPSIGRATSNQYFAARLQDIEVSLGKAMRRLHETGRSFRVERVPLCYMAEFAHCSTETRKIVKSEERIVHFLDNKGTVRQTEWGHLYADVCERCSLRSICGGLFDRGDAYDPAELSPQFVEARPIIGRIVQDLQSDPAWRLGKFKNLATMPAAHQGKAGAQGPAAAGQGSYRAGKVSEPTGDRLVEPTFDPRRRQDPTARDWNPQQAGGAWHPMDDEDDIDPGLSVPAEPKPTALQPLHKLKIGTAELEGRAGSE